MQQSELNKSFEAEAKTELANDKIEQNAGEDDQDHENQQSKFVYETPVPTLEMDDPEGIGASVRSGEFETRQAKLWMESYQEPKTTVKPEQAVNQQFENQASNEFLENLSDEHKAKVETYQETHQEEKQENELAQQFRQTRGNMD